MKHHINKFLGFTLAEVLITLGIIGVVAALTIPTLITKYQKKEAATRFKHAYSLVAQAVKMSEVENGPVEDWELDSSASSSTTTTKNFIEKYISPYLKTINKVQMETSGAPYDYFYYTRDGQIVTSGGHTLYSIALANGTYLHFNANYGASNKIELRIDINGMKKPNIIGRDTFYAYIYPKVEVKGTGKTREDLKNLCYQSTSNAQSYCSGLIQADGWEIKNDYPW